VHGAVLMTLSFLFLAYSAYVVPMQLSFWAHREACDPFPTLSFDLVVDSYFLVRRGLLVRSISQI
jgi:hypothetical protein